MSRLHLYISGRVQGVAFRAYAEREAVKLGLVGWVRNLSDGRVEVLAEGSKEKLEQLHRWCQQGPPSARVTKVETYWEPKTGEFKRFSLQF